MMLRWLRDRGENRRHDAAIRDWALYDAAVQDVGRALYVAETMIHLGIHEGRDPVKLVTDQLNGVRDMFAIPYAKERVVLCNCGEEKAENCPADCEMRVS